jgi:hypothetical protein
MAKIYSGRFTADYDGPLAVFLIGMRINKPWKVHKWWPVASAMPKMIAELEADSTHGFLGAERAFLSPLSPLLIQYWTSFDALETYARNKQAQHLPAWGMFMNKVGLNGDVGIWHETYEVSRWECVYGNMPRFGLAGATSHVEVVKGETLTARQRFDKGKQDAAE